MPPLQSFSSLKTNGISTCAVHRACPFSLTAQASYPTGRCVGIASYTENARFFVGADAHIGPEADGMGVSVFPDRSGIVPHGAMRASPPTVR